MLRALLRVAVPLVLVCTLGLKFADAAIYKWVDASGTVNISNLAPPDGVHVISVVQESPPRPPPRADPDRDAAREQEVQVLADRVRQLEFEAEFARRQTPPTAVYQAALPPVQYSQYPPDYGPPPTGPGCDPSWAGCGGWWGSYGYPTAFVVLQPFNFRRDRPVHGNPKIPVRRPMGGSSVAYRR
jgi:Domain of unknown function (DUF4124)